MKRWLRGCCSCKGSDFSSQNLVTCDNSQPYVTQAPEVPTPLASKGNCSHVYISIYTGTHIYIELKINF